MGMYRFLIFHLYPTNCDSVNAVNWQIDPPTGYTLLHGTLGMNPPFYGFPQTYGSDY